MTDSTLRETLRETPSAATIREGTPTTISSATVEGRSAFRGLTVLEQLPTRGAEADIFLMEDAGEKCILKLYRHRLEPKIEVLERIREVSRAHSDCFVVFRDAGFDETVGRWFELLEYLPLGSLKDVSVETRREPDFIRNLIAELAEAIHCLHENGIIHCDIKPGNVLVRTLDPLDLVLTDFGIASLLAADVSQKMTGLKGTPMYWAPEAFSRMAGRPGDWWGLGMIVLELLAGAHPFSGLTDSQIVHRLTIGNVEIPDALDDEWKPLLKGLLTKDDSKRWGRPEVARWLAGERDVPVYYETLARAEGPERKTHPFRFEAKDYHTPRELARMLCEREQPWAVAPQFLRYIRSWLESNMLFDEAVELANETDRLESDMALFRFVHRHANGPFAYLGKIVDANNLKLFLARAARQEASFSERRIVRMLGDGSLIALYDEYAALSGKSDPTLRRLLVLMDKRQPVEQWRCFEALNDPDARLWPKDLDEPRSAERALDALERLRTVPLKKAEFEELRTRYVLPERLTEMLASSETYAAALNWLDGQRDRDLLIAKDADPYGILYERMGLDEYEDRARIVCMGHTPAFLEKLDAVRRALEELPPIGDEPARIMVGHALERLQSLRRRKVDRQDTLAVRKLARLFDARRKQHRERQVLYPVAGCAGAAVGGLALFSRLLSGFPLPFTLLLGAFAGCGVRYLFDRHALALNLRRIVEACEEYCESPVPTGEGPA